MEKLLQLLNEYRLEKGMSEYTKYISETGYFTRKSYFYEHYSWVISKKFGFIQWLIKNDKIDIESYCRITSVEKKGEKDVYRDEVDSLLMLLAIQDGPIEFLCSIIK